MRYVDDTFTICNRDHIEVFTEHINKIDDCIKFTRELEANNTIAFLDAAVKRSQDGSLYISVYRKPTHTDQYLHFSSHHPLHQKLGVVRTLYHRCDSIVTAENDRISEKQHLQCALKGCGYPLWALKDSPKEPEPPGPDTSPRTERSKCMIVLPYAQGVSEKLCRVYKKHQVNVAFKPAQTLRQLLVRPKDKTPQDQCCGAIYQINCDDCAGFYVGETARQLKTRIDEHKKSLSKDSFSSAIAEHAITQHHNIDWGSTRVVDREQDFFARKVREAIHIRMKQPTMNRDGGLDIPHIYDSVLTAAAPPSGSRRQSSV